MSQDFSHAGLTSRSSRLFVLVVALGFFLAACGTSDGTDTANGTGSNGTDTPTGSDPADGADSSPLTHSYEGLDLSSPRAAVQELVDSYQRGDFITSFLIFHEDAQYDLFRQASSLDVQFVTPEVTSGFDFANMTEHGAAPVAVVDDLLTRGRAANALTPDAGAMTDLGSAQTDITFGDEANAATVSAKIGGAELSVIVQQADDGRWRVRQLVGPGQSADPDRGAFAFEDAFQPTETVKVEDRSLYSEMDLSSPESAVQAFVAAELGDFFRVNLVLSPNSQIRVFRVVNNIDLTQLVGEPALERWGRARRSGAAYAHGFGDMGSTCRAGKVKFHTVGEHVRFWQSQRDVRRHRRSNVRNELWRRWRRTHMEGRDSSERPMASGASCER